MGKQFHINKQKKSKEIENPKGETTSIHNNELQGIIFEKYFYILFYPCYGIFLCDNKKKKSKLKKKK